MKKKSIQLILLILISQLSPFWTVAQREPRADLVIETGHSLTIYEVDFSPDGKLLASASGDGTAKIWNVETRKLLKTLSSHKGQIYTIKFSPNGKTLASGQDDKTITLWNVETGTELTTLNGHSDLVRSVAFAPDGKTLASGSFDKTVKLWDIATGVELSTLTGHQDVVQSVRFSPDGKILASGSSDKTIRLWNVLTGHTVKVLSGHTDFVASVAFSPGGQTLASGSQDGTIRLWNIETGSQIKTLNGGATVEFSPDGKTLAAGTTVLDVNSGPQDFVVKLWNVNGWKEAKTLTEHTLQVFTVKFSPDGKTIASGSYDTTINLWSRETGKPKTLKTPGVTLETAISPDGRHVAKIGEFSGNIVLWSGETESGARILRNNGWVESITFSPSGKMLAAGTTKEINLWDTQTGRVIKTIKGVFVSTRNLIFSRNERILISIDYRLVKVWDVETGTLLKKLSAYPEPIDPKVESGIICLAASPDEEIIATGGADRTVRIWNLKTGQLLKTLNGLSDMIMSVVFSQDGKLIAAGSSDKTIKIWQVNTGDETRTLNGHSGGVNAIAFSMDGKALISESADDNTIRLWDVNNGQTTRILKKNDPANARQLSPVFPDFYQTSKSEPITPDGRFQAETIEYSQIRLNDLKQEKEICTLFYLEKNEWIMAGDEQTAIADDNWVVTTPEGRFDTNKSLDRIEGLHWVLNEEILKPLPLEIFMRQYYEPSLLSRLMKCTRDVTCDKEFKPLPPIAAINRVRPGVALEKQ